MNDEYPLMSAPLAVNWNYSYKCQLNCAHCYSRERNEVELSLADKYKVANNIVKNKIFTVNIGGGEPVCSEGVFEIIYFLRKNNVDVSLSTNGWLIDRETAEKLAKAKLNQVSISIDHSDPSLHDKNRGKKDSFQRAICATRICHELGIKVIFSTTITSVNYDVLEKIVELADKVGADGVDFKRLKTMGNARNRTDLEIDNEKKEQLYKNIICWRKQYKRLKIALVYNEKRVGDIDGGCPCGKVSLCVSSNGNIYPCVYNNQIILGNAVRDDLGEIWRDSSQLKYMREHYECMGLMKRKAGK